MNSGLQRLTRLLDLVDRKDTHLLAVRYRLLGNDCGIDPQRMTDLLATDFGIDRLESFGA